MIPSIESIVDGLLDGTITSAQAVGWLHQHAAGAANELRDYFAAEALTGLVSGRVGESGSFTTHDGRATVATVCYFMADAMLKAREA